MAVYLVFNFFYGHDSSFELDLWKVFLSKYGKSVEIALPYFYFLAAINFLYPLGITLTCFYVGRGKTFLILLSTIGLQLLKIALAYLFIFGWGNWIPSFGILGGAISTAIAHGSFCLFLFFLFLSKPNALLLDTRNWKFKPKLFWECIHPGLLRVEIGY